LRTCDEPFELRDHLATLSNDVLATMVVVLADCVGILDLDEGPRAEMEEVLIADMASGSVERLIAGTLGGRRTRPAQISAHGEKRPPSSGLLVS
jgi:hypothetical protein